jgi:phosphoglycerate dehydrogenase-like enzyme
VPVHRIFIATPLEPEQVERIRDVACTRLEVIYEPDILPPTRYVADHEGAPFVRSADQERRWKQGLAAAEILWDMPPSAEDLSHCKQLKWIQTTSTGVGRKVLKLGLADSNVIVTTARGVHAGPLAEFVFLALLLHVKRLRHLDAEQRAHRWQRYCGEELAGRTLVAVGAGDLARGAARVARAFGMRVVAVARDPAKARAHRELFDEVVPVAALREALAAADAVVVTVPHTEETEHLIDAPAFAAMKRGVAFVNIARGIVIDEEALIACLRSGQVGFAALDVATKEPLPPESALWDMPNVLISPHSASTVRAENARIADIFRYNLGCYLRGDLAAMKNVLDKSLLY